MTPEIGESNQEKVKQKKSTKYRDLVGRRRRSRREGERIFEDFKEVEEIE